MVLFLGGCSAFSFLFERLDWLVGWKLDQMYQLDEAQELIVEEGSEAMQDWFRHEAFPLWVEQLQQSRSLWREGKQQSALLNMQSVFEQGWQSFLQAVKPEVVRFALTLDAQNAEHFRQYNTEQQKDWFEYARSGEAKVENRIERLEDWFGDLDPGQEARVAQHILLYPNEYTIRIDNNRSWNERLLQASLAGDAKALSAWLDDPSQWWTEDYRQLRTFNRAAMEGLLFELLPTLSADQKEAVDDKVSDWINSLVDVMGAP